MLMACHWLFVGFVLPAFVLQCLFFIVILILIQAVSQNILSSSKPGKFMGWLFAISQLLIDKQHLIQTQVSIIRTQVETIVHDIENRKIVTRLNIVSSWRMSVTELMYFSGKFVACVEDNALVLVDDV